MAKVERKLIIGIGDRIRSWRKSKNLKAYKLAKILRVSQGSLSDIENGNSNPSANTIQSFILFTEIDLIWLMTGVKEKEDSQTISPHFEKPEMEIMFRT